jgi:uncharacterized protein
MDKNLLQVLACPHCKEKLFYSEDINKLECKLDSLQFPIEDNVPNLTCKENFE